MFGILGQIGKALLPTLMNVGGQLLSSSPIGTSLKKFGKSQFGDVLKNGATILKSAIQNAPD